MMKVLQVGAKNYPPAHGGTERVVYNIVNSIADVDFHLLVEWQQEESDKIHVIPQNLGYFGKMKYILNYAKKNEIDIIHFHNEKYIPMAMLLSVVFSRIVLTVHAVHFRSPKFSWLTRIVFWVVDVLGTVFLHRMVHCDEYDARAFGKYIFFRNTYFVNNGTSICDTIQKESDVIYKDKYVYLGRITPAKNLLALIEAADKQKIKVDLYGKLDSERQDYCDEVLAAAAKSDYVEYKGEIPFDMVFETMKQYRAFLYVTIMEGLPLSVLEAASCGMPLILSNIPHHTFLKLPVVTYVNTKKPEIPYPEQIKSGEVNRQHVIEYFSIENMGREYKKIYDSLIQ